MWGLNIAKNPNYDEYKCGLASIVYTYFNKKTFGSGIKNENDSNKELAEESHKAIIRKYKKRKVHSSFTDNFWGKDLPDMQFYKWI